MAFSRKVGPWGLAVSLGVSAVLSACGGGSDEAVDASVSAADGRQASSAVGATRLLPNGSFEAPVLPAGSHVYGPADVSGWSFIGSAVLATRDSGFSRKAPDLVSGGAQMVAIQNQGAIRTRVQVKPGDELWLRTTQRANHSTGDQRLVVRLDGQAQRVETNLVFGSKIMNGNPQYFAAPLRGAWSLQRVRLEPSVAGEYTLSIEGDVSGQGVDVCALVDLVELRTMQTTRVTGAQALQDPGFEGPVLADGAFAYRPTGGAWAFTGGSALMTMGSAFARTSGGLGLGSPFWNVIPQGRQAAVLQGNASVVQNAHVEPGDTLVFRVSRREPLSRYTGGNFQKLQVLVDGVRQTGGTVENVNAGSSVYFKVDQGEFAEVVAPLVSVVEAGTHRIELRSEIAAPYPDASLYVDDLLHFRVTEVVASVASSITTVQ